MDLKHSLACFAFFLLNSGSESATQVVNGTLGISVYLYESISDQGLSLQWNFRNLPIASRFPGLSPGCTDVYAGRCQLYDNGTLRLDNVRAADEGTYIFTVLRPPSTIVKETSYDLKTYPVLSGAVLRSNGTNDHLIGGTFVSLHCDASNQTVTTYIFYRKSICFDLHVTCQDAYLHFQPITESDNGSYTCTIQNPVSSSTSNTLQMNVTDPVSDVMLTSNISGLVWPGLDFVSLTCSARGTNVSYSWSLQGAPLPTDAQYHLTENRLTINPVSTKDNGTFTCTVSNWINNQTSNWFIFNLASAVSSVMVISNASRLVWAGQESVFLHCSALGSAVSFLWSQNGEALLQDPRYYITHSDSPPHSNLTISPISRSDTGPFTCTASNKLRSETSSLTLSLGWPPEGHMACLAEADSQYMQLTCSWPGGRPGANVTMVFNNTAETGPNQVSRRLPANTNVQGSTMMCYGDHFGRASTCEQKFGSSSCHGLGGGEVAGIVFGVVAGILIMEVIVFFVIKTKKKIPSGATYENSPSHIYSLTIPGTELKPTQQESYYEQLSQNTAGIYNNLEPSTRKQ